MQEGQRGRDESRITSRLGNSLMKENKEQSKQIFFFNNTELCFSHTKFKMSIRYPRGDIKKENRNMSQGEVRQANHQHLVDYFWSINWMRDYQKILWGTGTEL